MIYTIKKIMLSNTPNSKGLINYLYNIIHDIKELNKILSNLVVNKDFNNGSIIYDNYINHINKSSRLYTLYMSLSNNEPKRLDKIVNNNFNNDIITELNYFSLYYNILLEIYEKIIQDLILHNKNFIEVYIESIDDDKLIRLLKSNTFTLKSLNFEFKNIKTIYKRDNEVVDFNNAMVTPSVIENDSEVYNKCYRLLYISWNHFSSNVQVNSDIVKENSSLKVLSTIDEESYVDSSMISNSRLSESDNKEIVRKKSLKENNYRYLIYLNNKVYAVTDTEEKARNYCFDKANSYYKTNHKDFYIMNKPIWNDYNTCIVTSRYRYMFPFSYDRTEFTMNYVIIRDI